MTSSSIKKRYRKKRRTRRWRFSRIWKKLAMSHGNSLYDSIYMIILALIVLLFALYFLGFLEFMGLRYEPDPPPPPSIESAPA